MSTTVVIDPKGTSSVFEASFHLLNGVTLEGGFIRLYQGDYVIDAESALKQILQQVVNKQSKQEILLVVGDRSLKMQWSFNPVDFVEKVAEAA